MPKRVVLDLSDTEAARLEELTQHGKMTKAQVLRALIMGDVKKVDFTVGKRREGRTGR